MDDDELSHRIRRQATRHTASERLRAAVRTQIALQAAARPSDDRSRGWRASWQASWQAIRQASWRRIAGASAPAGFVAGVALTLLLTLGLPRLTSHDTVPAELAAELVVDHVQAMKAGALIQVASSDRHQVKPWFQGKVDYAPQVVDLSDQGFPLLGGRIDRVAGSATATLAYARRLHQVSAFVWPSGQVLPPQRLQRKGFNLLHWADGSMQVWLVSDVEADELDLLARAWQARTVAAAR